MKNILLAVCGMTPQVITETLYVLQKEKGIQINEIRILSTSKGADLIQHSLLDLENGKFWKLLNELKIPKEKISFGPEFIYVFKDEQGRPLDDIRNDQENKLVADQILGVVKGLTYGRANRIYASLAGGRKSMGAYLALAMQLFGRPDDKLYHILVQPPELENDPEFFFPESGVEFYSTRKGKINVSAVKLELAEINFVKIRKLLPSLGQSEARWEEVVKEAQKGINAIEVPPQPVKIVLKKRAPSLRIGNQEIKAQSMWIFIYYLICAYKKTKCKKKVTFCPESCVDCFLTINEIIEDFDKQKGKYQDIQIHSRDYAYGKGDSTAPKAFIPDESNVRSYISKINRAIRNSIVNYEKYQIVSRKKRSGTKYGIPLLPEMFEISES